MNTVIVMRSSGDGNIRLELDSFVRLPHNADMQQRTGSTILFMLVLAAVALLATSASVGVALGQGRESPPWVRLSLAGAAAGVSGIGAQLLPRRIAPFFWRAVSTFVLWLVAGWLTALVTGVNVRYWLFGMAVLGSVTLAADLVVTAVRLKGRLRLPQFTLANTVTIVVLVGVVLGLADIPARASLETSMLVDIGWLSLLTLANAAAARPVVELPAAKRFVVGALLVGISIPWLAYWLPFREPLLQPARALWFAYPQVAVLLVAGRAVRISEHLSDQPKVS